MARGKDKERVDLGGLFEKALKDMKENRGRVNDMDDNGNHGDNMVQNLQIIANILSGRGKPADLFKIAGEELMKRGAGGTSRYYAEGFEEASQQFEDREELATDDVMPLLESILGSIPNAGHPPAEQKPKAPVDPTQALLEGLMGVLGGAGAIQQQQAPPAQAMGGGSILEELVGMAMGGGQRRQQAAIDADGDGIDTADLARLLIPAGIAYMQAKAAGLDNSAAAQKALIGAISGGTLNPFQAGSARSAAGGLIAQSILKSVFGQA